MESGAGDDLSGESELADSAVLDLDVSEAVESLLAGLVEESEGVEESDRGLGTELRLELLCTVTFICRLFIACVIRNQPGNPQIEMHSSG